MKMLYSNIILPTYFFKYIKSSTNKGKGNALNNAKDYITTKFVVIHDADLEYFPEDLVEMFEKAKLNPQSLIIGSRFIGNKERKNLVHYNMSKSST